MVKIIFVGTSPGNHPPDKSPTIKRITKWAEAAGVVQWTWTNLVEYKAPKLKLKEIEGDVLIRVSGYKVIAMGNMVSEYFTNKGIHHLKVPHPSGLNRMWNDPELEPKVIEEIRGFTFNENCGIIYH